MNNSSRVVDYLLLFLSAVFGMITAWFIVGRTQNLRVSLGITVLVGLITVGLFACLWIPKKARPQIALMTVSIFIALYLFEIFLSGFGNPLDYDNERFWAGLFKSGRVIDRTPATDMYIERKDGGENVTLAMPSASFLNVYLPRGADGEPFFPLSNEANKTAVYCNESGERILYETDEHGFHNPRGIWAGEMDVAIVGDSFANGACVPTDENAVTHIRKQIPRTITVGTSGNGPLLELAVLREYIAPYTPETVVWWYFEGNDFLEIQREKQEAFVMQYMERGFTQNLLERQDEVDKARREFIGTMERLRRGELAEADDGQIPADAVTFPRFVTMYQLRRLLGVDFEPLAPAPDYVDYTAQRENGIEQEQSNNDNEPVQAEVQGEDLQHYYDTLSDYGENLTLFKQTLGEAQETVYEWGGEFIVVYIPQWERYGVAEAVDSDFHRDDVMRVFGELELSVLDFKEVQDTHPDPLSLYPYRINGHYNAEGYQLLGDAILDYLDRP